MPTNTVDARITIEGFKKWMENNKELLMEKRQFRFYPIEHYPIEIHTDLTWEEIAATLMVERHKLWEALANPQGETE